MDYKDLAEIAFPNVKPISYYKELYPKRDLPEGAVVSRFAPSPTGFVHIGGIYQSLCAKMMTEKTNGVFFLRIEDTDQKREVENGVLDIINAMKNFGLEPDEGMINQNEWKGEYGPYKQSMRKEIYQSFAKHMLSLGKAYLDFSTKEDDEERKKKQELAGVRPGCYGVWATGRNISVEEAIIRVKNGEKFVVRFKSPGDENRKIQISDVIKGKTTFSEYDIDIIIIKEDGLPTYHFAHLVDDYLMGTTHVIRADEWFASLPLHIQLFKEIGFEPPKYCHIAPIIKLDNGNKRKLSKRKDQEAAVSYYMELGIPVDGVKEYLLNIANSNFEIWRKQNPDKSIKEFDFKLEKMGVSGALFDWNKLYDVSKNVISRYTAEEIYDLAYTWAEKYDLELKKLLDNKEYSLKVLGIERNNTKPRKDISKWSELRDSIIYMYETPEEFDFENVDVSNIKEIAQKMIETYDINADNSEWFENLKNIAEQVGYAREVKMYKENPDNFKGHIGDIATIIRIIITGRKNTPDLCSIMKILGEEKVRERLEKYV